jgi:hypothetical protein
MNYYMLSPAADDEGVLMKLTFKKDHRARTFAEGIPFSTAPGTKPWYLPPAEPVQLNIEPREGAPLPNYLNQPVPLLSRALYEVLRGAGVDNLDVYRAELRHPDGRLESDDYLVFNLIGVVKAVDLSKSKFDADQPDREISMSIDSTVIDPAAARDLPMFRLAENLTTVVVNERIKEAIDKSGLPLISVYPLADVALL